MLESIDPRYETLKCDGCGAEIGRGAEHAADCPKIADMKVLESRLEHDRRNAGHSKDPTSTALETVMIEAEKMFDEWWVDVGADQTTEKIRKVSPSKEVVKMAFMDGYLSNTESVSEASERILENLQRTPTYQDMCAVTEAPITPQLLGRLVSVARDLHGLIGVVTEVGELLDAYKKYIFYGKPLDKVNIAEEIGDMEWYLALLLNVHNLRQQNVQGANIAKLKTRYPDKFTEAAALNRDLTQERGVLDKTFDDILEQDRQE